MKKKNYTLASATLVGLALAASGTSALANDDATTQPTTVESTTETPVSEAKPASAESPTLPTLPKAQKDVVILHTNDVHGRIVEETSKDRKTGEVKTTVIGDAKLAAVIENERAKDQTTLVVDAGDAFQGLPISNSTKGEARAEILNKMNYDAMAVGNHEFDFGLDEARKYKEILKFPLLSSNTYVNGARLFEASTIIDKDKTVEGDEIVVIGVTTPETGTKTHPKNIQGVTFTEPIDEVNKVIAEIQAKAKAEDKDYQTYVILAHLGVDTTTPNEWRGSTLAEALSKNPALKGKRVVVIDGHSHTVESITYGENVTYNQTGSYLNNVGRVTFKPGKLLGENSFVKASETTNLTPNAEIKAMVDKIKAKYDADNAIVVVEKSPVELSGTRENVRVRETNLGNVVTDALYNYGQAGFANKTDLAVTNGGGLRETIAKDKAITKGSVIAVLPFGNTITQIKVTGQNIKDMFEKSLGSIHQVTKTGEKVLDENGQPLLEASGGFLQVSGAKVYYDVNLEPGKRVLSIEIKDQGKDTYSKLDLEKTYHLVTNDFLAAGGDGYTMLGGAREEGPSMDVAFEEYLKATDLTKYEVVNPNSRTISISSEKFQELQKKEAEEKLAAEKAQKEKELSKLKEEAKKELLNQKGLTAKEKTELANLIERATAKDTLVAKVGDKEVTVAFDNKNGVATKLAVKELSREENSGLQKLVAEQVADNAEVVTSYDIHLEDKDGNVVKNDGTTRAVTVAVVKGEDEKLAVYYVNNDKLELIPSVYNNGNLTFFTSHFSTFTIVKSKNSTTNDNSGRTEQNGDDSRGSRTSTFTELTSSNRGNATLSKGTLPKTTSSSIATVALGLVGLFGALALRRKNR